MGADVAGSGLDLLLEPPIRPFFVGGDSSLRHLLWDMINTSLNTIRQGNREFREFLQDFEQTLLEAQAWGWTEEAKKDTFGLEYIGISQIV